MKLVAIEGPSLTGKSTVVARLKTRLAELHVRAVTVPCFVDWSRDAGLVVPSISPRDWEEQLRAVGFFLRVDEARIAEVDGSQYEVAILDRSCRTVIAHTHALIRTGRLSTSSDFDVWAQSLTLRNRPDATIYLDSPQEVLESRASSRTDLPLLLQDAGFNRLFREYFLSDSSLALSVVDGSLPLASVVDQIADQVCLLL